MLSLLLGFAQAHVKHMYRGNMTASHHAKIVEADDVDALTYLIPKNPRHVKSFRPVQSTEAVENGGVTKVDVGIRRVWVYLNDDDAKSFAAGCSIGAIVAGFIPEALASKIVSACCGISGILVTSFNRGNGVILKIPHPLGQMLLGTPAICSQ